MLDLFKPQNVRALEVKYDLVPYTKGIVLDLGCGPWKTYPHFIGVDNCEDWPGHIPWRPDIVADCLSLPMFASQSVDAVFSSHLLNEIEKQEEALKEWWRVIKHGGYLVLYLPVGKDTKYAEDVNEMVSALPGGWDCIVADDYPEYQSFLQVYQKRSDKVHKYTCCKPKPDKTCAIVRYGGAGDMIQTSSVLPLLKDEGYHITLYCSYEGYPVIQHDPHVDEFIVQQPEQVPNNELGAYWKVLKKKYTRFINFSESVEKNLLAMPNRIIYEWPTEARHKVMNKNYLEMMHTIAKVPFKIHTKFYATPEELQWVKKQAKGKGRIIHWILSGSSVHKAWPFMDQIIARILLQYPDAVVVLSGDFASKLLERGWEETDRVWKTSGEWSMRQSMVLACHGADLVIGPETGVMNAVSMLDVPKIITLSHSSVENLTRDWVNTVSLVPKDCPCWPCHQLHYGWDPCVKDEETGVALCQAKIGVEDMWQAIQEKLNG